LEPQHKGSKPRTATPAVQAKVCRKVQQKPIDGSTHWSVRKLAVETGVSKSSVHRILSQARLQPHRLERYMASNDPDFETKAADRHCQLGMKLTDWCDEERSVSLLRLSFSSRD